MPALPDAVVGNAYRSREPWETLKSLTALGSRMAGHAGETAAARFLERRFADVGLRDVTTDEFAINRWERQGSSLTVETDSVERAFTTDNECIALPGSPAAAVDATLVDVGYGLPADFADADVDGTVVLVTSGAPPGHDRWVHRNEKYARAIDGGAVGFLYVSGQDRCLPETGCISFDGEPGPIPGLGLSHEVGYRLRLFCEETDVDVGLSVDCRTTPSTSQNVSGVLGPERGEEILVTAHYDSHDISEGAGDDGCGTAVVTEIARLLQQVESDIGTRVRVVAFGAEEVGMLGADHWADTHDLSRVKCQLNVDGIGDSGRLKVNDNGFEAVAEAFSEVADHLAVPVKHEAVVRPHGDQWPFVRRGVPGIMAGSAGDGRFPHAHTHSDTIDKIDPRDLVSLAIALASGVYRLAERDREIPHVNPDTIRDSMHPDYEAGLRAEGRWPWEPSPAPTSEH